MTRFLIPLFLGLSSFAAYAQTQEHQPKPVPKNFSASTRSVSEHLMVPLLLAADQQNNGSNSVSSAYSLGQALQITRLAARGRTLDQIETAIFGQVAPQRAPDPQLGGRNPVQFSVANAGFFERALPVKPSFLEHMKRNKIEVKRMNFDAKAVAEINRWFSDQTGGKITQMLDRLSPDDAFVLANALYFKAPWDQPFDVSDTKAAVFNGKQTVDYMQQTASVFYAQFAGAQAVRLDFAGLQHSMIAILPPAAPQDWLKAHSDFYAKMLEQFAPRIINLSLPKFALQKSIELGPHAQTLGLSGAFSPCADFTALSDAELRIGRIAQQLSFAIDELGAEASAATAIVGMRSIAPSPLLMRFDRPFIVLLTARVDRQVLPFLAAIVRVPTPSKSKLAGSDGGAPGAGESQLKPSAPASPEILPQPTATEPPEARPKSVPQLVPQSTPKPETTPEPKLEQQDVQFPIQFFKQACDI